MPLPNPTPPKAKAFGNLDFDNPMVWVVRVVVVPFLAPGHAGAPSLGAGRPLGEAVPVVAEFGVSRRRGIEDVRHIVGKDRIDRLGLDLDGAAPSL